MSLDVHFSSASTEWETPQNLFDRLDSQYHFTLDVAASKENAKCKRYYDEKKDGLKQFWGDNVCWMNPPYNKPEEPCQPKCTKVKCQNHNSQCPANCKKHRGYHIDKYIPGQIDFVRKAFEESRKRAIVVCLIPARTDTEIWHQFVFPHAAEILFIEGRLTFGGVKDCAPFPSAIVVFDKSKKKQKIGTMKGE